MDEYKDLEDMIEIITTAIAIHEREEEFFRRSAEASSREVAKELFTEISEDLSNYRKNLEARKQKLLQALSDLTTPQKIAKEEMKKESVAMTRDPVCNMLVDEVKAKYISTYKDKKYYFCSPDCKKAFDLDPQKYVRK
jgi:YHS domain-containing protein